MIIDFDELTDEGLSGVTVCIVGSGAAGITLACELDAGAHRVLLLEAGEFTAERALQDWYHGAADAPHPAAHEYRRIAFGGTTAIWGGRCVPFDPIDFETRDYVADSGWPIDYAEVARYYPRALKYLDAGAFEFSAERSILDAAPMLPGVAADGVLDADLIERYSLPTHFGKRYRQKIAKSANVTAVLRARCIGLIKSPGEDRVSEIEVASRSGKRRRIGARFIVLAAGGIETARLLLASQVESGGLGNRSDRLGRYYACHLEGSIGKLVPQRGAAPAFDFEKTRDGVYCRRKIQFTPAAQREHRLLNTAFRLHFPEYSDASHGSAVMSSIYLAKSFLIAEYRSILQQNGEFAVLSPAHLHLRNVLRGGAELPRFAYDWIFRRKLAQRKLPYTLVANADGSFPLEFNCEQTPLASSRIVLTDERDTDGVPRVRVEWRRSEEDIAAATRAFTLLKRQLQASGALHLEYEESQLVARLSRTAPLGGHHIGTTRMAATASQGVVDRNCALFDFPNVFVASSAVFPTGSYANPTLTIVALALRLAERLQAQVAR